ncbi:uncharacterized protein CTRU02_212893 [Colletotrichum truncatum]|uniref:Uncharacterized protein n=1 Tax=Colletotrichum truncatum TaxID=5467 RepID=A0ACC3YJ51_COLTU
MPPSPPSWPSPFRPTLTPSGLFPNPLNLCVALDGHTWENAGLIFLLLRCRPSLRSTV